MFIKVLSPVHIGDGEDYNRFSFLIKDKRLCFIDAGVIREVLNQSQMEELNRWLKEKRNPSLYAFLKELGDSSLVNKMASQAKYSISFEGQVPARVFSFIKSRNKPYIPGSEVKGAFRTALLYKLIKESENFYKELEKKLKDFGDKKFARSIELVRNKKLFQNRRWVFLSDEEFSSISQDELKRLFKDKVKGILDKAEEGQFPSIGELKGALAERIQEIEEKIQARAFRPFARDAKYDLLKLLWLGDSEPGSPSEVLIASPVVFVGLEEDVSEIRNYHEVLKPGQEFELDLRLPNGGFKPNFLQKFCFSSQQSNLVKDKSSLFQCVHEFYAEVLEEEIAYYSSLEGFDRVLETLRDIKNQNTRDSPVIRLGKHEGFLSLTLGLMVKKESPELYQNVLVHATKGTSYSSNFPKTRKLARVNGKELPLGWVRLRDEK